MAMKARTWCALPLALVASCSSAQTLERVDQISGRIFDTDGSRILYLGGGSTQLTLRNVMGAPEQPIAGFAGQTPSYGFLAPNGAIFATMGATVNTLGLYNGTQP
ncbi:MAG TPA: hypothetical protein VHP37_03045 [Burkholderiales bacterium]|nr:hypothetical protein [Burkholderiales bacterium]